MALLLGVAEVRARHRRAIDDASFVDAMLIGIAQVGALIPGISRSGSTLTAALALGFKRDEALVVTAQMLSRLSPSTLYGESILALLDPTTRTLGPLYLSQLQGAVIGAPLPLWDSVMVAWPQIVGLIAASILLFVGGYIAFQRQEVRA
jgi:ABC-2 type transport system permease protein